MTNICTCNTTQKVVIASKMAELIAFKLIPILWNRLFWFTKPNWLSMNVALIIKTEIVQR